MHNIPGKPIVGFAANRITGVENPFNLLLSIVRKKIFLLQIYAKNREGTYFNPEIYVTALNFQHMLIIWKKNHCFLNSLRIRERFPLNTTAISYSHKSSDC